MEKTNVVNLKGACNVVAIDRVDLQSLIKETMMRDGNNCSLNHIDTSHVSNMRGLFHESPFNGDISEWDVSHVEDMSSMFQKSQFNGDISKWDVSNVNNMGNMFWCSAFNQDISNWDTSTLILSHHMFRWSKFTGDLRPWNLDEYTLKHMFEEQFSDYQSFRKATEERENLTSRFMSETPTHMRKAL